MGFRSNNHEKEPHSFDIQAWLVRKSYILIVASTFHDRSREVQPLLVTHHTPKLPLLFERPFSPPMCMYPLRQTQQGAQLSSALAGRTAAPRLMEPAGSPGEDAALGPCAGSALSMEILPYATLVCERASTETKRNETIWPAPCRPVLSFLLPAFLYAVRATQARI